MLVDISDIDIDRAIVEQAAQGESLYEFVQLAFRYVIPQQYIDGRVVREVCLHLEAVSYGQIRKLIINMPPSFMKSLLTCVFWPTWHWIRLDVKCKWIFASYDQKLTYRDAERSLDLIRTNWFRARWGDILYDSKRAAIGEYWTKTLDGDGNPIRSGMRFATTVRGRATGHHAHVQVVDDPINPMKAEAVSKLDLDKTNEWWDRTMSSRAEDFDLLARVIIMQRLHGNDLTGYCEAKGDYEILRLPMEYESRFRSRTTVGGDWRTEDDELLWPEKASEIAVASIKKDLGSAYAIAGQLQQRPTPQGGLVFEEKWFRYWHPEGPKVLDTNGKPCKLLPLRGGMKLQSWDLRFKKTGGVSRVSGGCYWYHSSFWFVLDNDTDHYGFIQSCDAIRRMAVTWPDAGYKLVEAKANGDAAEETLCDEISGIELVEPKGGSMSRALACQSTVKTGHCVLPHPDLPGFGWVRSFLSEVCGFPFAAYDDQTDQFTQALNYIDKWEKRLEAAMKMVSK